MPKAEASQRYSLRNMRVLAAKAVLYNKKIALALGRGTTTLKPKKNARADGSDNVVRGKMRLPTAEAEAMQNKVECACPRQRLHNAQYKEKCACQRQRQC